MITIDGKNPITPKRVVIVDPSLTDFRGHHAQYDISVSEACEAANIIGCVLAHKAVSDSIDKKIPVVRTFSEDMWGGIRLYQFEWLDIKLFLLGCISSVLVPVLARNHLARLKYWWSVFIYGTRTKAKQSARSDSSFVNFIIYVVLHSLPCGISSLATYKKRSSRQAALFQLIMPPFVSSIWRRRKAVYSWLVPPIFFDKRWPFFLFILPVKTVRGLLRIARLAVPKLLIEIFEGMIDKLRRNNFLGAVWPKLLGLAFENPRYYYEALRGLRNVGLNYGDLVFFHMVIGRNVLETAVLCEFIFRKTGIAPIVLLRYPPHFMHGFHPLCLNLAIRKFEHLFESGKIRLASDSHRLIDEYAKMTYVPFELFPIPHGASHLPKRDHASSENGRVRVVSLGNARAEKGFIEIYRMMQRLAESNLNLSAEFVIQANDPDGDAAPYVKKLKKACFPFPVSLITKSLDKDDYEALVASADVILAPYWREIYWSRTSGVALEALVGGKILITTEDTWMSDQAHLWRTGLTVENRNAASLTKTVLRAITNRDALMLRARTACKVAASFHCGESFVGHLVRKKISWVERNNNVCFFYPWGNLFQYNSGASVYSSLMVKKIVQAGWHVTVIGQLVKSIVLPKGVTTIQWEEPLASFSNPLYLADYVQRLLVSPQMVGLEDFQYRFRCWMRSRAAKLAINSALRHSSAAVIQYPFLASLISPFANAYEIPVVLNSHDVLGMQTKRRKLRRWILDKEIEAFNVAHFSSVISEEDRQTFEELGARTHVIANSIDIEIFTASDCEEARRRVAAAGIELPFEQFGLFVGSAHYPNFVAAKRIAEFSQNELLVSANIGFVIVGDCVSSKLAAITRNCRHVGRVPRSILQALYALASFVVIPLESGTGSSVKTLEALAYGKAVIGTKVAFRGFDVANSQHCIICNDFDDYPRLITELLGNAGKIKEIEICAKSYAKTRDYRVIYKPLVDAINGNLSTQRLG